MKRQLILACVLLVTAGCSFRLSQEDSQKEFSNYLATLKGIEGPAAADVQRVARLMQNVAYTDTAPPVGLAEATAAAEKSSLKAMKQFREVDTTLNKHLNDTLRNLMRMGTLSMSDAYAARAGAMRSLSFFVKNGQLEYLQSYSTGLGLGIETSQKAMMFIELSRHFAAGDTMGMHQALRDADVAAKSAHSQKSAAGSVPARGPTMGVGKEAPDWFKQKVNEAQPKQ